MIEFWKQIHLEHAEHRSILSTILAADLWAPFQKEIFDLMSELVSWIFYHLMLTGSNLKQIYALLFT